MNAKTFSDTWTTAVEAVAELSSKVQELRIQNAKLLTTCQEVRRILGATRSDEPPSYVCQAHNLLDDVICEVEGEI